MDKQENPTGTHQSSEPRSSIGEGVTNCSQTYGAGPTGAARVTPTSHKESPVGPSGLPK